MHTATHNEPCKGGIRGSPESEELDESGTFSGVLSTRAGSVGLVGRGPAWRLREAVATADDYAVGLLFGGCVLWPAVGFERFVKLDGALRVIAIEG